MTFSDYIDYLHGKRIGVIGFGVSNQPLVRVLLRSGCDAGGAQRAREAALDSLVGRRWCMGWAGFSGQRPHRPGVAGVGVGHLAGVGEALAPVVAAIACGRMAAGTIDCGALGVDGAAAPWRLFSLLFCNAALSALHGHHIQ